MELLEQSRKRPRRKLYPCNPEDRQESTQLGIPTGYFAKTNANLVFCWLAHRLLDRAHQLLEPTLVMTSKLRLSQA